jgi:NAD(P)-dependent dehydrogenase (short-subunit alcohol dehydrogenase family)
LEALTREWAAQRSRYGIRINTLARGFIDRAQYPAFTARPAGGLRRALLLLASDAGRYISGQPLLVDGGWTAR